MTVWIANARMYSVAPPAAAAWRQLLRHVSEQSGAAIQIIDHGYPAPISELWQRNDHAATLMCGWPYSLEGRTKKLVAAPIPDDATASGRPRYRSLFVVRRDAPFASLEETFGGSMGFTVEDSHSGYNAPRFHLSCYALERGAPLYGKVIGGIPTPRLMIEAVRDGRVNVGPIDSYAYALLSRHVPELADAVRVIDATEYTTIPAFVASPSCPDETVAAIADALIATTREPALQDVLADLCLTGFAKVSPADYDIQVEWAELSERRGYPRIA